MLLDLFVALRAARVPVSLREHLDLMAALEARVAACRVDDFYHLARAVLVKDERNLDKFDRVFAEVFKGLETDGGDEIEIDVPEAWLRKLAERHLSAEEKAAIEALGGWERLMEALRRRLAEQRRRHQGGRRAIGTAGTSPFGAHGYNPEGVRIGGDGNGEFRAVKVWQRREFRNLDDSVVIGTRNIKLALRRLRRFAREGAELELDLAGTVRSTADNGGALDIRMVPERRNAVKVLLLLDVGGSMTVHTRTCEELFSAARAEFKHLKPFYFHNCPYEEMWRDNRRRRTSAVGTAELLNTYGPDYRLILVGDATMSPYEITVPGGSIEHWNAEAGAAWLARLLAAYPKAVWLNPTQERRWPTTPSIEVVRELMSDRMYPLTLDGLDRATRALRR